MNNPPHPESGTGNSLGNPVARRTPPGRPGKQGLYDPWFEHEKAAIDVRQFEPIAV